MYHPRNEDLEGRGVNRRVDVLSKCSPGLNLSPRATVRTFHDFGGKSSRAIGCCSRYLLDLEPLFSRRRCLAGRASAGDVAKQPRSRSILKSLRMPSSQ